VRLTQGVRRCVRAYTQVVSDCAKWCKSPMGNQGGQKTERKKQTPDEPTAQEVVAPVDEVLPPPQQSSTFLDGKWRNFVPDPSQDPVTESASSSEAQNPAQGYHQDTKCPAASHQQTTSVPGSRFFEAMKSALKLSVTKVSVPRNGAKTGSSQPTVPRDGAKTGSNVPTRRPHSSGPSGKLKPMVFMFDVSWSVKDDVTYWATIELVLNLWREGDTILLWDSCAEIVTNEVFMANWVKLKKGRDGTYPATAVSFMNNDPVLKDFDGDILLVTDGEIRPTDISAMDRELRKSNILIDTSMVVVVGKEEANGSVGAALARTANRTIKVHVPGSGNKRTLLPNISKKFETANVVVVEKTHQKALVDLSQIQSLEDWLKEQDSVLQALMTWMLGRNVWEDVPEEATQIRDSLLDLMARLVREESLRQTALQAAQTTSADSSESPTMQFSRKLVSTFLTDHLSEAVTVCLSMGQEHNKMLGQKGFSTNKLGLLETMISRITNDGICHGTNVESLCSTIQASAIGVKTLIQRADNSAKPDPKSVTIKVDFDGTTQTFACPVTLGVCPVTLGGLFDENGFQEESVILYCPIDGKQYLMEHFSTERSRELVMKLLLKRSELEIWGRMLDTFMSWEGHHGLNEHGMADVSPATRRPIIGAFVVSDIPSLLWGIRAMLFGQDKNGSTKKVGNDILLLSQFLKMVDDGYCPHIKETGILPLLMAQFKTFLESEDSLTMAGFNGTGQSCTARLSGAASVAFVLMAVLTDSNRKVAQEFMFSMELFYWIARSVLRWTIPDEILVAYQSLRIYSQVFSWTTSNIVPSGMKVPPGMNQKDSVATREAILGGLLCMAIVVPPEEVVAARKRLPENVIVTSVILLDGPPTADSHRAILELMPESWQNYAETQGVEALLALFKIRLGLTFLNQQFPPCPVDSVKTVESWCPSWINYPPGEVFQPVPVTINPTTGFPVKFPGGRPWRVAATEVYGPAPQSSGSCSGENLKISGWLSSTTRMHDVARLILQKQPDATGDLIGMFPTIWEHILVIASMLCSKYGRMVRLPVHVIQFVGEDRESYMSMWTSLVRTHGAQALNEFCNITTAGRLGSLDSSVMNLKDNVSFHMLAVNAAGQEPCVPEDAAVQEPCVPEDAAEQEPCAPEDDFKASRSDWIIVDTKAGGWSLSQKMDCLRMLDRLIREAGGQALIDPDF